MAATAGRGDRSRTWCRRQRGRARSGVAAGVPGGLRRSSTVVLAQRIVSGPHISVRTVPVKCTTGPLPPIVPLLVPLPVMALNSPMPPVISQRLKTNPGNGYGLALLTQTVPRSARVIDPVAPVNVIWAL
jgi:hypothetical protein